MCIVSQPDFPEPRPFWRSRTGIALLVLAGVAAFLLLEEHQAHVLGALPYLLLLACPLMHLLMHHGHNHGRNPANPQEHQHERH